MKPVHNKKSSSSFQLLLGFGILMLVAISIGNIGFLDAFAQTTPPATTTPTTPVNNTVATNNMDVSYNISSNSLNRVICNAFRIVTGGAGKTFAAFAIVSVGVGFFTGKVSWGLMIGVAAGIATMFGAPSIVAAISGQDTEMMCAFN